MRSLPSSRTDNQKLIRPAISDIKGIIELFQSEDHEEAEDLPQAFDDVSESLGPLAEAFTKYKEHSGGEDEASRESTRKAIGDIAAKTTRLHELCKDVIRADTSANPKPRLQRYRSAVKSGELVELLVKDILEKALKHVAKEPFITAGQVKELEDALDKVKKIPRSLIEEGRGYTTFYNNNNGAGVFNVKAGEGPQNVNTGAGQIFEGGKFGTLNFGVPVPPQQPSRTLSAALGRK